jgi:hypothetical protein
MLQVEFNGILKLIGKGYSLSFHQDRPFVSLAGKNGQLLAELFAYSGVHPLHTRDDAISPGVWEIEQTPELGGPSLYYATHIDATGESLSSADYRLIRQVWDRCRRESAIKEGVGRWQ